MEQIIYNKTDIFHKILPAKFLKYDVIWIEGNELCAYNSKNMFGSHYSEQYKSKFPNLIRDYRDILCDMSLEVEIDW
jgi:hypothetical protein